STIVNTDATSGRVRNAGGVVAPVAERRSGGTVSCQSLGVTHLSIHPPGSCVFEGRLSGMLIRSGRLCNPEYENSRPCNDWLLERRRASRYRSRVAVEIGGVVLNERQRADLCPVGR